MSSRERILGALRQRAAPPFPDATPPATYRPVVPRQDVSPDELRRRFINQARQAGCVVHEAESAAAGVAAVLAVIGTDVAVSSWDMAHLPLPSLAAALDAAGVARVGQDAAVRVGLTGADAALAATGSLVLLSGPGRPRAASLLPPVHVAVVAAGQIVPDLESWWAAQAGDLEQVRQSSSVVVVTGPSRTADIAMQLVMGMHGPREVHVVVVEEEWHADDADFTDRRR